MQLIIVPGIALFFYMILFLALTAAKKDRLIYNFMAMILCFILWTAGSVMMRSQLYPGVIFWCKLSIFGMFGIPIAYYAFICTYLNDQGKFRKRVFAILVVICWGLLLSDQLLSDPQVIHVNDMATFSFDTTIWMVIPICYVLFVAITVVQKLVQYMKQKGQTLSDYLPMMIGIVVLTLGTLASTIPAIGKYPIDTCSGIVNALCLLYTLYKRRLFKMTLVISRGAAYLLTGTVLLLFSANVIQPVVDVLHTKFPFLSDYITTITVLFFSLITCAVFFFLKWFIDLLFIKEDQKQAQLLRSYSANIASCLELKEICKELVHVIGEDMETTQIMLCLKTETEKEYKTVYTSSSLTRKNFTMIESNPCIQFLKQTKRSTVMKEFRRSVWYKSMWENEKHALDMMQIDCMVPLLSENDLIGIIFLSHKAKPYSTSELTFLDSLASISAIAINNAYLYQSVYEKASSDHLTGLLNREFFFREVEKVFLLPHESIILAILNIDDFSLYNELYGRAQGDLALQNIAFIMKAAFKNDPVLMARYSGKEFAVLFMDIDLSSVKRKISMVVDQIRKQNELDNAKWKKVMTLSVGIGIYPFASSSMHELITNTEMAVFTAKQNGKNRTVVYTMEEIVNRQEEIKEDTRNVYAQYAPTISALTAAIDVKDHYTFHHSANVAEYATILAKALGLNKEHIELIRQAALLHDIGKIGIPEDILNKEGKLTEDEYRLIQTHVENSISIIRHLPSLDYVIPAVLGHHERWDGKGYPRGLRGDENPIAARCICVADTFDAMTTKRSYRDPLPLSTAIDEIKKGANTQFDPKLANLFVQLIEEGKVQVLQEYDE